MLDRRRFLRLGGVVVAGITCVPDLRVPLGQLVTGDELDFVQIHLSPSEELALEELQRIKNRCLAQIMDHVALGARAPIGRSFAPVELPVEASPWKPVPEGTKDAYYAEFVHTPMRPL